MGFISYLCHRLFRLTVDITVLLLIFVLLPGIPPYVSFSSFEPQELLPLEGPLTRNNVLDAADRIMDGKIVGPESIASRNPEEIFVSLHGGKILRIWGPRFDHFKIAASIGPGCDGPWQERVCGRPLGLRFAPDGRLLVADAYLGLFAVDVDTGEQEKLFDNLQEIDGLVPKIPDDLDVDAEGNIYWSDASTVSSLDEGVIEYLSDPSGRILKFESKTKTNTVLVKNVHFANGVQLSPDQDFILFCETFKYRVMRYWLKGAKAGQTEVFVDRLPGTPDNIRNKEDGGYYVALVTVPSDSSKKISAILAKLPLVRKFALRLMAVTQSLFQFFSKIYPEFEQISSKVFQLEPLTRPELVANVSIVVELDADGNIINSLQGNSDKLGLISQTTKVGDYLFFGSPYKKYLGCLFVGPPPIIEVDGKGVKIKTENDTDKNEAEDLEPGVLKNEEDEPQVVKKINKKIVEEEQEGQVEEFVGVKVEENISEENEKLMKEKVTVEHTEALEMESHKETKDEKEQEPLQQNTEWSYVPEEDIEVKTKENQEDDRDLKKEVGKEEL